MRSAHPGEHIWAGGKGQTGRSGDRERMRRQRAAAQWHKLSWWRAPASEKPNQFARGVDPLAQVRAQTGLRIHKEALRFQARLEVRHSSFESFDNRHRFVRPRPSCDVMSALFLVTALNRLSLRSPSHELSSRYEFLALTKGLDLRLACAQRRPLKKFALLFSVRVPTPARSDGESLGESIVLLR
jgi:hypothetical protein